MIWAVSLFTMDLITHSVSPVLNFLVFGVCIGLVSRYDPLAETVLYPQKLYTRRYLNSFRGEPAIAELD